jgi:hypothetical protein
MTMGNEQVTPAPLGPVERIVRAPHPERAAFEAWWCRAYHPAPLQSFEDGCYMDPKVGVAWDAWMAARPGRAAVGRLVNIAAAMVNGQPLYEFGDLVEAKQIGHRQFERAHDKTRRAMQLLGTQMYEVVRAL